jgi:hypothetical protein
MMVQLLRFGFWSSCVFLIFCFSFSSLLIFVGLLRYPVSSFLDFTFFTVDGMIGCFARLTVMLRGFWVWDELGFDTLLLFTWRLRRFLFYDIFR